MGLNYEVFGSKYQLVVPQANKKPKMPEFTESQTEKPDRKAVKWRDSSDGNINLLYKGMAVPT